MFGWLTSACADTRSRPRLTLAGALQMLPAMGTAAVLTEKLGEPDYHVKFNHDDPADNTFYPNRQTLENWRAIVVATPDGLIET